MKLLEKKVAETTYKVEFTKSELELIVTVIGRSSYRDYLNSGERKGEINDIEKYMSFYNSLLNVLR